eukprot:TRINITY_DN26055_c0_g1_i2.p2 TRINITY_DN26055_c0_g1~~TRINITY_DN26055_c0_g1_i2.p2  ORF type:complete len:335 (+),score=82.12 TRINITY_DN26055_c0_g1_i2:86-1090(+)
MCKKLPRLPALRSLRNRHGAPLQLPLPQQQDELAVGWDDGQQETPSDAEDAAALLQLHGRVRRMHGGARGRNIPRLTRGAAAAALERWKALRARGRGQGPLLLTVVLKIACWQFWWRIAQILFNDMRRRGVEPTAGAYAAVMVMLSRRNRAASRTAASAWDADPLENVRSVERLYREAGARGLMPHPEVEVAMMVAYVRGGLPSRVRHAFRCFDPWPPPSHMWSALATTARSASEAQRMRRAMRDCCVAPNLAWYGSAIVAVKRNTGLRSPADAGGVQRLLNAARADRLDSATVWGAAASAAVARGAGQPGGGTDGVLRHYEAAVEAGGRHRRD